ncbi:unnamed protein product [Cyclocybe aegerita]|uniref:CxC2-like cysteine cluster KDZ transposase-associated domain-containing protein n=1 Tax=Cyclocybe aegerita TaxID=1973307 RepID=A0A8S0WHE4_CYCAE|nr:unnamed protein product [Cyclocybe aegerita]
MPAPNLSLKSFKKNLDTAQAALGRQIVETGLSRQAEHTSITGSIITHEVLPLPAPPPPLRYADPLPQETEKIPPPKKKASEQLQDFVDALPELLNVLMDDNSSPSLNMLCQCGAIGAVRTTLCRECFGYELSCSECFIRQHSQTPTHWADVWNATGQYFVRHDISTLREKGYAIHLSHNGNVCPNPASDTDIFFHLIDVNSVHHTKIQFCGCPGALERPFQLLKHRLFPATLRQPKTAFTFRTLKTFHILHLELKVAAYDFIRSLRRLTDNMFAHKIPDPYPQFRLVVRVWRLLTATKRLGQVHGIDMLLPNRPAGNLSVYCPACPEPEVNMEPNWQKTLIEYRHLNQTQHTLDSNHHANKFIKNTDPDNVSLFGGRACFPDDAIFQAYLKSQPANLPEKTTCSYLNAVNKQNRKKFNNMDITGIVNAQCGHVFVKSSVDLQLGERFANTDYALAMAIRQYTAQSHDAGRFKCSFITSCDHLISYDISCAYWVNMVDRFKRNFPDLVDTIRRIRFLIPLVHVQNHKDNCMYQFSSAYTDGTGHFHGETAEHIWPELNQLGAQTRQMNNGNRQETLSDHHNDWNWKKTANLGKFWTVTHHLLIFTHYLKLLLSAWILTTHGCFLWKNEKCSRASAIFMLTNGLSGINLTDSFAQSAPTKKSNASIDIIRRKFLPNHIYEMLKAELSASDQQAYNNTTSGLPGLLNEALEILKEQRVIQSSKQEPTSQKTSEIQGRRGRL